MIVKKHFSEINADKVDVPGANNTSIRWLIAKKDNAENFALRMFELGKDGNTPDHTHNWEHEVFVLEGNGMLVSEEGEFPLDPGDFAFVPEMILHHFKNVGDTTFKFLCIVPIKE